MPRPHIEFIQAQALGWRSLGAQASRPGAAAKPLSYDAETRAVSAILRYPPGWALAPSHHLDSDEEFFVLAGTLRIAGECYAPGDYAYLPAGFMRTHMECPEGADVLTFYEGPHRNIFAAPSPGLFDPGRLIAKRSTAAMPWEPPRDPLIAALAAAPRRKTLREDAASGEQTWLLAMNADDPGRLTHQRTEVHPVVEESFLLEGEISMPCGVMRRGAYFWRPPGIEHGPVGTRAGFTAFFRTKGGGLATRWSAEPRPIVWDAPYAPVLPAGLADGLSATPDPTLPY
jgi:hypothetical protein